MDSEVGKKIANAAAVVRDNVSINIQQNGAIEATNNSGGDVYYSSSKQASSGAYSISFTVYAGHFEKQFKTVIDIRDVELNNKKLLVRSILHAISAGVISVNNSTDVAINFPFDITVGIKLDVNALTPEERDAFLEDVSTIVNTGVDNGVYGYMESKGLPMPKDLEVVDETYVKQSTEFEFMTLLNNLLKTASNVADAVQDALEPNKQRPVPVDANADFTPAMWDQVVHAFELTNLSLSYFREKVEEFRDFTGKPKSKSIDSFAEYTQQSILEQLEQIKERYSDGSVEVPKIPKYSEKEFVSVMETAILEMKL